MSSSNLRLSSKKPSISTDLLSIPPSNFKNIGGLRLLNYKSSSSREFSIKSSLIPPSSAKILTANPESSPLNSKNIQTSDHEDSIDKFIIPDKNIYKRQSIKMMLPAVNNYQRPKKFKKSALNTISMRNFKKKSLCSVTRTFFDSSIIPDSTEKYMKICEMMRTSRLPERFIRSVK